MISDWIDACDTLATAKADFYTGARKILRARQLTYEDLDGDLLITDAGYTKSKLTLLRKLYLHEESRDVALELWDRRLGQGKYGSVGFTTYNHFIKNDPSKKSKRASVMGPCIQSVTLTLLEDGRTGIDVFYRTTELFKKYPADLVFLRDTLLEGFKIDRLEVMTHHFANITCHPMYYVTIIPHHRDPIKKLERLKRLDPYFYQWIVKWTARYICDEHHRGIAKFAQAMRVCMDARGRIKPDVLDELRPYLLKNHPGYSREYVDPDEDE